MVGLIEVDTGSIRTGMVNRPISSPVLSGITPPSSASTACLGEPAGAHRPQAGECLSCGAEGAGEALSLLRYRDQAASSSSSSSTTSRSFWCICRSKFRHRQYQLRYLYDLVRKTSKPVIVAGDFNTYWGDHEIYLFMQAAGLANANARGLPSYPSSSPRKELDFILHSSRIEVNRFEIPEIQIVRSPAADLRFHDPRTRPTGG